MDRIVPDWFDLEGYKNFEGASLSAWHSALFRRRSLLETVNNFLSTPERDEGERSNINTMLEHGFAYFDSSGTIVGSMDFSKDRFHSLFSRTLHPVALIDFVKTSEKISEPDLIESYYQSRKKGHFQRPPDGELEERALSPLEVAINKSIDDRHSSIAHVVYAKVNLAAPEKKLLEDFSAFIREYRSTLGISETKKKRVDNSDIEKLIKHRVIQYIDLSMWGRLNEKNLTASQIVDVIFPEGLDVDAGQKVGRTLLRLGREALSNEFINRIMIEAYPDEDSRQKFM